MASFPETKNDLEGLTLKYEWLIFIEKALKIQCRFSQLLTFFSIHQIFTLCIFKTKQPRGSFEKEVLKNEDQSMQHEAPKSQKQIIFKKAYKVDALLWT